ncbi:hypothetical protein [Methylobrevis albus]|nr:hypothetical protein [Methylobrevis albus]
MLLPTGHVMLAGALAVAASLAVVALVPARTTERLAAARLALPAFPRLLPSLVVTSTLSFIVLLLVLAAGLFGYPDPLRNPLSLTVWTLFWVVLPIAHALLGNLWRWLNPFSGPCALLDRASGGGFTAARRPLPARLGYLPAIATFLGFAWFELVYPAPDHPETLGVVVGVYVIMTFAFCLTYGPDVWLRRGDPFGALFGWLAGLSPYARSDAGAALVVPGAQLLGRAALPLSGVLLLLLTLSTVSFDGTMKTFWWLGLTGVNPLEFPGRTAVMLPNTLGLIAAFAALAGVFFAAISLGRRLAGGGPPVRVLAGRAVFSIVPIAVTFHLAHYLTALLINGQYAALALNDPFGRGWNLFALRDWYVTTSFLGSYAGSRAIFAVQTAVIVIGHVLGVLVCHLIVAREEPDPLKAFLIELPLGVVMVGYTVFGLWLLSTPVAG